jgi:hypothetical protein
MNNHQAIFRKIFIGSSIAMLFLMTFLATDYGVTGDEPDMNEYGKAVLSYYASFGKDTTVFNMPKLYNRDGIAHYYGGLFDLIAAVANKISPLDEYDTRHVLNAITGFMAMLFTGLIAARLGGWRMGLIGLWLIFLSPRFFGHSMNNPKDIPFATASVFSIWAMYLLLDKMPGISWRHIILLAAGIAAAINIRVGGVLLIGYIGLFMMFEAWHIEGDIGKIFSGKNLKNYLLTFVAVGIIGYFGGCLFWPFALQNPITNPLKAMEVMSNFKVNIRQLFEGQQIFSNELPAYYLPKYISITTPVVFLTGLILFAVFYWFRRSEYNGRRVGLIVFSALFPVVYIIYTKANVYHEFRHVQFAYPSFVIIAALGWETTLRYFQKPIVQYASAGAMAILCILPAGFMITSHPYQYLYYNEFVGGLKGAHGNYVTDYWMQSMNEASRWLIKNAQQGNDLNKKIIVGTTAPVHVKIYLKDHLDKFDVQYVRFYQRHEKQWDYGLFYADYIHPKILKNKSAWPLDQSVYVVKTSDVPIGVVVKRPDYSDYLGLEALNAQQIPESRHYLEKAIRQYPNSDIINFYLGVVYSAYQDKQNATLYLSRAAQLNPDYAPQARQVLSKMQ